jgi:hypothetical protein
VVAVFQEQMYDKKNSKLGWFGDYLNDFIDIYLAL